MRIVTTEFRIEHFFNYGWRTRSILRKAGVTAGNTSFGWLAATRPTGVRRAAGVRAAGPDRLLFFVQRYPPKETSIGPGKRSLDLLLFD
jgi:hypothetical protein